MDITHLLTALGLSRYTETLSEFPLEDLVEFTDDDFKELGVLTPHRKKLLAAITALNNNDTSSRKSLRLALGFLEQKSSILFSNSVTFSYRSLSSISLDLLNLPRIPASSIRLLLNSFALNLFLKLLYFIIMS